MKIDMNQDLLIKNALFYLLSGAEDNFDNWNMERDSEGNLTGHVEVECSINGIPVDLVELIKSVNSSFEARVEEGVREVLKEKFQDIQESVMEIEDSIRSTGRELALRLESIYSP